MEMMDVLLRPLRRPVSVPDRQSCFLLVIPAKAGIHRRYNAAQARTSTWMTRSCAARAFGAAFGVSRYATRPGCAGTTTRKKREEVSDPFGPLVAPASPKHTWRPDVAIAAPMIALFSTPGRTGDDASRPFFCGGISRGLDACAHLRDRHQ